MSLFKTLYFVAAIFAVFKGIKDGDWDLFFMLFVSIPLSILFVSCLLAYCATFAGLFLGVVLLVVALGDL